MLLCIAADRPKIHLYKLIRIMARRALFECDLLHSVSLIFDMMRQPNIRKKTLSSSQAFYAAQLRHPESLIRSLNFRQFFFK